MAGQVTQQDIYDRIAAVDVKIERLIAQVNIQMDHGARKMSDLEQADEALGRRVTLLEQARWRATGAAAVIGAAAGGIAGSVLAHVWH